MIPIKGFNNYQSNELKQHFYLSQLFLFMRHCSSSLSKHLNG